MLGSECGFAPEVVRRMTLHDVRRISNHWKRYPPLRMLVSSCARALGVELPDPNASERKYLTADEFAGVVRQFGQAAPITRGAGPRPG